MSFGTSLGRFEDAALLDGTARFIGDMHVPGTVHLALARSPLAHARLGRVDVAPASGAGVVGAWAHADLDGLAWDQVGGDLPPRPVLAGDRVRFVGEPVAAVVAETPAIARDAASRVDVDYAPLPVAATPKAALAEDAPLLFPSAGTNLVYSRELAKGSDPLAGADLVVRRTIRNQRVAPVTMETRGVLAVPNADGLLVYAGQQNPHKLQRALTAALGDETAVRVVVPPTGGGFGARSSIYPEDLLVARLALRLGRPVQFVETRTENLMTMVHGRDQTHRIALGATRDGRLVGLDADIEANLGAYVDIQWHSIGLTARMLSGCYAIPAIAARVRGVVTNTAPTGAYRGAGRPEAAFMIERMIDVLAGRLDMDPVELRMRNFIQPEAFPSDTGLGAVYDSGNYPAALRVAVDTAEAAAFAPPAPGRVRGTGIASYVELSSGGSESAAARIDGQGRVTVTTGTSPTGQGHHTAFAQLAADELGMEPAQITVVLADTGRVAEGGGTAGSRSISIGGAAIVVASSDLAAELKARAADRLEAAPEDIVLHGGTARVAGTDVGVDLSDLAGDEGIEVASAFEAPNLNFPFGCHLAVVDVETETGEVDIVGYVAVDDCGRVLNPLLVEGQLIGGTLQGIGQALHEEATYDEMGNPQAASLLSYSIPAMRHAPRPVARRTETPSPNNPRGTKGTGESGTTGATPAVTNAVINALAPLGVADEDLTLPLTPEKVWRAMRKAGVA